jgi:TOMM system kinase/cyclase fusion protein
MRFSEVVEQVLAWLQRQGRVSYRALKREFALDDEYLQDLKAELIDAQRVAADEDGKVLVWLGGAAVTSDQLPIASSPPPDTGRRTSDAGLSSGERRQLTVMFCDVVGSTALSTQLDPEELRAVILAYRKTCAAVISRFGGHLAKYIGDGLLVYFGYPQAHEDDAQRAVRAGLEIVAAFQASSSAEPKVLSPCGALINQGSTTHNLRVRIGIHTGLVVAGEMGVGDQPEPLAIVGETPNVAARLQEQARPDSVVISPTTYRLVAGLFECQDLGPRMLKGLPAPLSVYRVSGESDAQNRFEVAVRSGLTPLIGREHEMGLLQERWEKAGQREGQAVLLSGEAGIGKSRLAQELRERLSKEGATCLTFRCSPYHRNSAFSPIIELLQRVLQFSREDSPTDKLQKLEAALADRPTVRPSDGLVVPLLASLLSLPLPDRYPPLTWSPQKQKQKTQEALVSWLVAEAERAPVYCVWEDLHWADPSTLEVLALLLAQVPTARLLTVLTFRPEFVPPWGTRSHISQLSLSRLGRHHVGEMVERVAGDKALPQEILQQIVAKTDGVPLFVEELTKTVVESGVDGGGHDRVPIPTLAIPTTLHDSLMARLDRLGPAKEIAQLGATLGREFNYELLQAVSPLDEEPLQHGLRQLVEAELLYQRGLPPQAIYFFKHALVQDAAYQSLLKSTRQQYHSQIARVLEERFPETKETQPELLAHHSTEAGLIAQAISYWQRAGERATQRSAPAEAIVHLTKGLELLKTLSNTPERLQQELLLQTTLGLALMAAKGYAAPEVEQVYARAQELCRQMGETPQLFPVLLGLQLFYVVRAELRTARKLAEQILLLAQSARDPALLLEAHRALGEVLYFQGEFAPAGEHVEQVMALYDPRQSRHSWGWTDRRVSSLSRSAVVLWLLGYPDQARKSSHEALTLAWGLSHPYSLAWALYYAAMSHELRQEAQATQEQAEALITLSCEQGFPLFISLGTIFRGWALAAQGEIEEGMAQMHQGLASYQATGAEVGRPSFLALLAEAHGKVGQPEEGLTVVAEALAGVDKNEERCYEAEAYRLKGELTLQQQSKVQSLKSKVSSPQHLPPDTHAEAEAEACFHKAIEIARKQQARSLELRAVMSLSRLWQSQGKKAEARRMLAEIYGWFTEGFDTRDLQEAKALLEELRR